MLLKVYRGKVIRLRSSQESETSRQAGAANIRKLKNEQTIQIDRWHLCAQNAVV